MKNTTGLYKRQRDNLGKRRKLPPSQSSGPRYSPIQKYEYEKAREKEAK